MKQGAQSFDSKRKTENGNREIIQVTTSQLAYLFDISDRQIRNWVNDKGRPKLGHGVFDLKAVLDWWMESDLAATRVESEDLQNVKLEYWREKMLRERIKRQQNEESLIARDEIASMWASRMAEISSGVQVLR